MRFSAGEICGSLGVALLLFAFLMNLLKKWPQNSWPYIILNIAGAGLACISSLLIHFVPFIILEGVWAAVSIAALVKYFQDKKT